MLRWVAVGIGVLCLALAFPAPSWAEIEVGDVVVVTSETGQLKRGLRVVATVRRGQELNVIQIKDGWIGTAVEIDGQVVGGWLPQASVRFLRKPAVKKPVVKPPVKKPPIKKPPIIPESGIPSVPELMDRLKQGKGFEQLEAIDDLATHGAEAKIAAPLLASFLSSQDVAHRWRAARALSAMGAHAAPAVDALARCLTDESPLVRAHAARTLGEIGDASRPVAPQLGKLISDPDIHVRRAVVSAWRKIRPDPKVGVPILVKVLEDAEPAVKILALHAIAEAGRDAMPGIIEALKNEKARFWACLVLHEIGPEGKEAVPAVLPLLQVDEPELRMEAMMALGAIRPEDEASVTAIVAALDDKENSVRYAAAYALTQIGAPAKAAAPKLQALLEDPDPFLAAASAWALARVSPDDAAHRDAAIKRLVESMKNKDQRTRVAAAKALFDLKPNPQVVKPVLEQALADPDPEVVTNIVDAYAALGEAAVPRAIEALTDEKLRVAAIMVLQKIGPKAKQAVPALVDVLKTNKQENVRWAVVRAIQAIGAAEESVPHLITAVQGEDLEVRRAATFALGKIGPGARAAAAAIRKNLDTQEDLKLVSIWALVQITPQDAQIVKQAVPLMIKALGRQEAIVRFEAAQALGLIGPPARAAVDALTKARDDADPLVRKAAEEALKKIGP